MNEATKYHSQLIEIQTNLLKYIDQDEEQEGFQNFINLLNNHEITKNKEMFILFIRLLSKISDNHHRSANFTDKIMKILLHFKDDITKILSNYEIFDYFKKNKKIILFLYESQFFVFDEEISTLIQKISFDNKFYYMYFKPETEKFTNLSLLSLHNFLTFTNFSETNDYSNKLESEDYIEFRKVGENEDQIAKLIRNDLIDEFILYVNQKHSSYKGMNIEESIFETNSYLQMKNPSLLEYAAFYGSIKIFKYLLVNEARYSPKIWMYAIHGSNSEIIHLLEENEIFLPSSSDSKSLSEAIKCHHNDIANYIIENYFQDDNEINKLINHYSLKYYNFELLQLELLQNEFYDLCCYNYCYLVKAFVSEKKVDDINEIKVLNNIKLIIFRNDIYFFYKIQFHIFNYNFNMLFLNNALSTIV